MRKALGKALGKSLGKAPKREPVKEKAAAEWVPLEATRWVRRFACLAALAVYAAVALSVSSGVLLADTAEDGPARFAAHKCNLCHGVPAADIEAKTKSEKLRGPDLGGPITDIDLETLAAFLRKQQKLDGEEHKREFEGTDEELRVIVDWLAGLAPPAESQQSESQQPETQQPEP